MSGVLKKVDVDEVLEPMYRSESKALEVKEDSKERNINREKSSRPVIKATTQGAERNINFKRSQGVCWNGSYQVCINYCPFFRLRIEVSCKVVAYFAMKSLLVLF